MEKTMDLLRLYWSSLRTTPLFYIALGLAIFFFPWSQFEFFESPMSRHGFFFSLGLLVATLSFCFRDAERHFQLQEQLNAACEEARRTGRTVEIETTNGTIWVQPPDPDDTSESPEGSDSEKSQGQ